jgi:hypothetical protein
VPSIAYVQLSERMVGLTTRRPAPADRFPADSFCRLGITLLLIYSSNSKYT